MNKVTFSYENARKFIKDNEMTMMKRLVLQAKEDLLSRTGPGNDFLGWIDLPEQYDREEFARIQAAAEKIRNDSEVLVVIGIGGSYLGSRAAISFLNRNFVNKLDKSERKAPEIYFAGNSISGSYLSDLIEIIGDRDFSVNVISKSGTTTEPAIAFRVLKKLLVKKYGKDGAAKRIYATTDRKRGALKSLASEEGYETFVVPDDVGGRFTVLTAVGLLPIMVAAFHPHRVVSVELGVVFHRCQVRGAEKYFFSVHILFILLVEKNVLCARSTRCARLSRSGGLRAPARTGGSRAGSQGRWKTSSNSLSRSGIR